MKPHMPAPIISVDTLGTIYVWIISSSKKLGGFRHVCFAGGLCVCCRGIQSPVVIALVFDTSVP